MPTRPFEWPPRSVERIPLGFIPGPSSRTIELTEEQRHVAEKVSLSQRTTLVGPSGSGKTQLVAAYVRAISQRGHSFPRLLVLSPRRPLAMWLRKGLNLPGVTVTTIDKFMKNSMAAKWPSHRTRQSYDDPTYFEAALGAAPRNLFDLVVCDDWQATVAGERHFVKAVAGEKPLVVVVDPTQDLHSPSSDQGDDGEVLSLSTPLRSPGRVGPLDFLYSTQGFDPCLTKQAVSSVRVWSVEHPALLQERVLGVLADLRSRGFGLGEVGVVSGHARARSALATAMCAQGPPPAAYLLTNPSAMASLAVDSFAHWLSLERRAIILVETPHTLDQWRTKMHIGISRACEEVHLVLDRAVIKNDPTLAEWMAVSSAL